MKADIVIVNWNSGIQLEECINSVRTHGGSSVGDCIVVDNGSQDGSVKFLENASDVVLIDAQRNLGFGRACNIGSESCSSPFLLFLNPDARLMPNSLQAALLHMQSPENAVVGIAGVQLIDERGQVQRTCAHRPTPFRMIAKSLGLTTVFKTFDVHMRDWDHLSTRAVDHVMGAFFLIRRDLFAKLGGFDERFFVYLEDLDLSIRAARAGYNTIYLANAQAFHKGGGLSDKVKAHRLFYSLSSRIKYAHKHFSQTSASIVGFATLAIEPVSRLCMLVGSGRFDELGDLVRGYQMLWRWALSRRNSSSLSK